MLNQKNNIFLIFILFIIIATLISAFIIQYSLGHQPCKLCLYERIPYFFALMLILQIFFFKKYEKITFFLLFLVFILSTLLAFYHFGIEQGFFKESFVCNVENQNAILSKEQLLMKLSQNIISCKEVTFKILGLSLAAINAILSILFSIIFLKLFMNYGSNSTSQYK